MLTACQQHSAALDTLATNSGANLTNLNASALSTGTVPSGVVSGAYSGITGLGTVATGTWHGTTVATGYGGTGLTGFTTGDILYASSGTALSKLGIGTNNYVLTSNGTTPVWAAAGSGTVTSVGVSGGSTGLTTSGGPITTTGTITLGGTLATGYGGTGLTTFTAANNAIYSTSSSALTAGTLPTMAGGTGLTTFTAANNAIYSTGSTTLTAGTLPIAAGGTNCTSQCWVDLTTTQASIAGVKTFTGQLIGKGTATNDSAASGYIGEYICAQVWNGGSPSGCATNSSSPVSVAANSSANITSISLTAGDWEVCSLVAGNLLGSTTTSFSGGVGTSSGSLPSLSTPGPGSISASIGVSYNGNTQGLPLPCIRVSLGSTTTYYLTAGVAGSGTNASIWGFIGARRAR